MKQRSSRKGISFLNVLVAVVAVGFFIFFSFPSFSIVRERGRRTSCHTHLAIIGSAFVLYRADHENSPPTNITELIKYIGGDRNVILLTCPSRNHSLKGPVPKRISDLTASPQYVGYDCLSATSKVPGIAVSSTILPQSCDKPGNHGKDGITILFEDGHVAWWSGTIEEYAASNSLVITVNTNWAR